MLSHGNSKLVRENGLQQFVRAHVKVKCVNWCRQKVIAKKVAVVFTVFLHAK